MRPRLTRKRLTPDGLTKMESLVVAFIKANQPCSLQDFSQSGIKQHTVSNVLAKLKIIKRAQDPRADVRRFIYWIDPEFQPLLKKANKSKPKTEKVDVVRQLVITQHPLAVAFFGMQQSQFKINVVTQERLSI